MQSFYPTASVICSEGLVLYSDLCYIFWHIVISFIPRKKREKAEVRAEFLNWNAL